MAMGGPFFRTGSIAKSAIEVERSIQAVNASKYHERVSVGETLLIKQGWDEKEVVVRGLVHNEVRHPLRASSMRRQQLALKSGSERCKPERPPVARLHGQHKNLGSTNAKRWNACVNNLISKTASGQITTN